jgi:hypothetical protein
VIPVIIGTTGIVNGLKYLEAITEKKDVIDYLQRENSYAGNIAHNI